MLIHSCILSNIYFHCIHTTSLHHLVKYLRDYWVIFMKKKNCWDLDNIDEILQNVLLDISVVNSCFIVCLFVCYSGFCPNMSVSIVCVWSSYQCLFLLLFLSSLVISGIQLHIDELTAFSPVLRHLTVPELWVSVSLAINH